MPAGKQERYIGRYEERGTKIELATNKRERGEEGGAAEKNRQMRVCIYVEKERIHDSKEEIDSGHI